MEYIEHYNGSFVFNKLGVRSLANASRARQFNPLNPPGVGWVPLPQTNMAAVVGRARSCAVVCGRARSCTVVHGRAWSCAVVRGRARSCVAVRGRARSCAVGRAWSCVVVRGRARLCVRGRSFVVVRGRSCVVVRGRAVLPASRPARQPALPRCPLRGQHCRDTNERTNEGRNEGRKERTTSNNPLNPPGVGWVNFFYPIKVRVSMGTCVPNLGAIRRPVRKFGLSNL